MSRVLFRNGHRLLFAGVVALGASAAIAQPADPRGVDIGGSVSSRDNTRAYGTVFDVEGNPVPKVDVWVVNDNAPATRLRAKSRSNGVYQVRNVGRLYNTDDIYGIVLRLRFEAPGYEPTEIKVPVEKNALAWVYPILKPKGQPDAGPEGRCIMLRGAVTNDRGKPVKGASVVVTSPDDASLRVEADAPKGEYELLIWDAPERIHVEVSSGDGSGSKGLDLTGAMPDNLVAVVDGDVSI